MKDTQKLIGEGKYGARQAGRLLPRTSMGSQSSDKESLVRWRDDGGCQKVGMVNFNILTPTHRMPYIVKIRAIHKVTHDVLRFVVNKPEAFDFVPGQAVELSINQDGWSQAHRPFTLTSIPEDDYLEFIVKIYSGHHGVTDRMATLGIGDELIFHRIFGTISYKGEGVFIAGGAGITPFISILRSLQSYDALGSSKLLFANKAKADIILQGELEAMLKLSLVNILSDEVLSGYNYGFINEDFIKSNITTVNQWFYVCGPPAMMEQILSHLGKLGVLESRIVREGF
jgi:ferredoxin-NADP reductase